VWVVLALWGGVAACGGPAPPVASQPALQAAAEDSLVTPQYSAGVPENVPTALLMAGALEAAGEYDAALSYYLFALDKDPGNADIGGRTVEAALRSGRPRQALSVLARLEATHPGDPRFGLERARILLGTDDAPRALEVAAALALAHPDDEDVLRMHAQALVANQQLAAAAAVLERVAAGAPEDALLREQLGALYLRAGDADAGEARLRESLALDPARIDAANLLVERLDAAGRGAEALALLEDLVQRTPNQQVHRLELAQRYLSAGRNQPAVELLLPLAHGGELGWQGQLLLVDLLVRAERVDEAWALVQELLEKGFDGPLVLRMAGDIAEERDDLETAEQLLTRAVRAQDDDVESLVSLLLVRSRRAPALVGGPGEVQASERDEFGRMLERAAQLAEPRSLRQTYVVGALLRRAGRAAEAIPLLERAAGLAPQDDGVLYDLAVAREATRDYRGAAAALEELLALKPDDAHLLNFYGYLLADQGWELQRAEALIQRALAAEPENAAYLDSLGWVWYRLGRYEDALGKLVDASNRLQDDPTILEHLADALVALKRYDQAAPVYERALAVGADAGRVEPKLQGVRGHLQARP
jgi:tetratricopeptide (TPR) repeat protein